MIEYITNNPISTIILYLIYGVSWQSIHTALIRLIGETEMPDMKRCVNGCIMWPVEISAFVASLANIVCIKPPFLIVKKVLGR